MTREEIWQHCKAKHYSAAYAQYAMEHTVCEACHRDAVLPHHIRTRAAGGDDDAMNLLGLCADCHRRIHSLGVRRFTFLFPHLGTKTRKALERPKLANGKAGQNAV
jgi:hypothetical protein